MLTKTRPLIVGIAAPGLLWLATSVALGQAAPSPQGPPNPAPASPKTYRALLLTNGKVVKGEIVDNSATSGYYCLRGSGGPVPYPKTQVLKAAGSIDELYAFQVARLPVGDVDEQIKLAKWCLAEKLEDQAREQLLEVQKLCPTDDWVNRMLTNLANNTSTAPGVDKDLRRTSAEMTPPAALDPRVLKAQRRFNALPQIFDLPPAQAVRGFNDFAQFVQPVLQQNCAKCHDEKYQGDFQLVQVKSTRDLNNSDIARANLDATLRLVNPDDPSRSSLLSAGLVPHGPSKNAIFRGPNDRSYIILVQWVKSLRPAVARGNRPAEGGFREGGAPNPMPGDAFGSARPGASSEFPTASTGPNRGSLPQVPLNPPAVPGGTVESYQASGEFYNAAGDKPDFQLPFSVGGAGMPTPIMPPTRPKAGSATAKGAAPPAQAPAVVPRTATPNGRGGVIVEQSDDLRQLPGMNQPLYPTAPAEDPDPAKTAPAKKKAKPKIDPTLLENVIKNRNGSN